MRKGSLTEGLERMINRAKSRCAPASSSLRRGQRLWGFAQGVLPRAGEERQAGVRGYRDDSHAHLGRFLQLGASFPRASARLQTHCSESQRSQ